MNHIEKLQNYLIGKDKGYLVQNISKGKVLMLSGAWGSGKTYFWQEKIIKENKSTVYISLYGKSSIKDIENEVLLKAYYRSIGRDNEEKDMVEKISSTFSIASKTIDTFFGTKIDEIKDEFNNINNNQKNKEAKEFINDGLIICFDDFERKSSSINLQDLFGFITNLSLQYKSRIIIILNSDVFSGDEKKIFTNVKEKSVSKYISFSPKCAELFELIFDFNNATKLNQYKNILKSTFEKVNIINARIMIQVFSNLLEWVNNDEYLEDKTLELLILVNINFILNHKVYLAQIEKIDNNALKSIANIMSDSNNKTYPPDYKDIVSYTIKYNGQIPKNIEEYLNTDIYDENIIDKLKYSVDIKEKENATRSGKADNSQALFSYIDNNILYIRSLYFMRCFKIDKYCKDNHQTEVDIFNKINNFIEKGMM